MYTFLRRLEDCSADVSYELALEDQDEEHLKLARRDLDILQTEFTYALEHPPVPCGETADVVLAASRNIARAMDAGFRRLSTQLGRSFPSVKSAAPSTANAGETQVRVRVAAGTEHEVRVSVQPVLDEEL